jgi:hypothetical protein
MPAETVQDDPRVMVVASAAAERCAQICRALGAAGVDVVRLPDVYLALGELAGDSEHPPRAVVVQAACLESPEIEFFHLANRLIRGGGLYIFSEGSAEDGMLRAASAAGATRLDMTSLTEWATDLADASPVARTDEPPETTQEPPAEPVDAADAAPAVDAPQERPEPADLPPPLIEPVENHEPITDDPVVESMGAPSPPVEDHVPSVEVPEPEPQPQPQPLPPPDVRVARPIAVPDDWPLSSASSRPGIAAQPDDDSVAPAVPWRPPANRPTRTPPSARAAGPVLPDRTAADVELTREELDALLSDPTEGPDSRRKNR